MSYWDNDAGFLRQHARDPVLQGLRTTVQRLNDIAHDLERATPDGEFLEDLAHKIEGWVEQRVLPTQDFAEEIGQNLRCIALALKKDPKQ